MNSLTTIDFLSHLRTLDISLRSEDGRLQVCAPTSTITPELREQLSRRKPELLAFLNESGKSVHGDLTAIERISRDGELPLSFAQMRLWFLDQLAPGSAAYTISQTARIHGDLDLGVLERTLSEIVRRHEVLRTIFPITNGWPGQLILSPAPVAVELLDLRHVPDSEREAMAHQKVAVEARKPFDLTKGPLFRSHLLRLAPEDHVLVITVHHTVFDGWSMNVFWREFSVLYAAFRSGGSSPLPELPFQYADFSAWQKRCLEGPARESHLAYWRRQLEGNLSTFDLPADRPRKDLQPPSGARRILRIDPALGESLKALGQHEGVSLFMTLLAAFQILLYRLTGQEDILVGTPIAGRNRAEFEDMIGFFVNTIVVRARLSRSLSFRDFLAHVRTSVLDAQGHQDLPFEELVRALDAQRDLNRSPLFQVFYNHLNMQITPTHVPGLEIEPFGDYEIESKFDLTLYSREHNHSIDLLLLYNTKLFDEHRMAILLDQYAGLLQQICENPQRRLDEYSLVTEDAGKILPDPTAPLGVRWAGSVHARFLEQAARIPERIAVEDADAKWSYGQLEQLSAGLAAWLRHRGAGPGETVAVFAHRSAPLVLALLGVLRTGAAFCVLDPALPVPRLVSRIRAARPRAWLQIAAAGEPPNDLQSIIVEVAGNYRLTLPRANKALSMPELAGRWDSEGDVEPDSPAYLTFTSGTTGDPKCILGTHRPLSHFFDWHCTQFGLKETDRFSMLSGLAHDPLLRDIFSPLWIGAALCIPSPDDIFQPGRLSDWMRRQKITVAHLTPAMGALLAEPAGGVPESRLPVSTLRYAFFGGDVLTPRDVEQMTGKSPRAQCVNFYGTTETPQAMGWHRIDPCEAVPAGVGAAAGGAATRSVPLGRGISGAQLLVLNRAQGLAGPGELGEIYIRTPYLPVGYVNDERLTAERFLLNPFTNLAGDRLYRTSDLGRYRPDGLVEFAGRADQQIKIRGYRVEPGEIEAALATHAGVSGCAVVPWEDRSGSNQLIAYIAVREGHHFSLDELRTFLKRFLPDYMIPSAFVMVDALPLTPNAKIDRAALSRLEPDRSGVEHEYVGPADAIERTIVQIWNDVLGIGKIGVLDNFFELGGHSLSATRLIGRLRSAFRIDLPLRCIFLEPTIAGLAKYIRYDAATQSYSYIGEAPRWKCLVPAQPRGSRVPIFLVAGYQGPDDTLLVLSRIIPHLGPDQPVYGFKPSWIEEGRESYSSVEEEARGFLTELRSLQPNGPYLLGGYCIGGVIALEMARKLLQEGEKVGLLALIDTERPTPLRAFLANVRLGWRRGRHMLSVLSGIARVASGSRWRVFSDLIRHKLGGAPPHSAEDAAARRFYHPKVGYRRLIYRHSVKPYPGRITLFVNEKQYHIDKNMGWKRIPKGGLVVHRVPGDHLTMLTENAKEFARLLRACTDAVAKERGAPAERTGVGAL